MISFRQYDTDIPERIVENVLSPDALNELESYIKFNKKINLKKAEVNSDLDDTTHIRDSEVMWLPPEKLGNVYNELVQNALRMNVNYYNYNIDTLEVLQYGEYSENGHFTWHCDGKYVTNENHNRKLSFSLLLSDDYEGGDLEFWYQAEPVKVSLKKNCMVFFPSQLLHRVTPVTKGLRRSVVGWIKGPDFV